MAEVFPKFTVVEGGKEPLADAPLLWSEYSTLIESNSAWALFVVPSKDEEVAIVNMSNDELMRECRESLTVLRDALGDLFLAVNTNTLPNTGKNRARYKQALFTELLERSHANP